MKTRLLEVISLLGLCASTTTAQMMEKDPTRSNSVIAHATCMGLAFAFLMPVGAIVMRVAKVKGVIWYHAAIMLFAYILAIAGLGLGVYIAIKPESEITASNGHPIIGIIVVGLLLIQPPLGLIHHAYYKRDGRRTFWASAHVWWGRIIVTLAIINGGLGLQLSGNTTKGEIAYGVIAGVMWLLWVVVSTTSAFRTKGTEAETGEKVTGGSEGNGSSENGLQDGQSV